MAIRKIIHLDLDAFFCAVEELRRPELVGLAFAVGGKPNQRGVVASCSYAARQFGVHSAMPMARALRLCPGLKIVQPDHKHYHEASERVMEILRNLTPLMEQISIDEAFLDVSDLPQSSYEIATELQSKIRSFTQLSCSLGAASNKFVAKIATDVGKASRRGPFYPNAIRVVQAGEEAAFLAPLSVSALWGVGPKTAARLADIGINTIGELANYPEAALLRHFGKSGHDLVQHAKGIDDAPVIPFHTIKSLSQEITFEQDIVQWDELIKTIQIQSEQIGYRLREKALCGSVVRIKLRWPDFSTLTRQMKLAQPTDQDNQIYETAVELFKGVWEHGQPVRLLGVGVAGLSLCAHQLSLWDSNTDKERRLLSAIDALRERYGDQVVQKGNVLKKK